MKTKTTVTLSAMECGKCGVVFALTEDFKRERMKDERTFYCPNGHPRCYMESATTRLQRELKDSQEQAERNRARAEKNAEWARTQERRANGYKGLAARRANELQRLKGAEQ